MEFSEKLLMLRKKAGLSQKQLAIKAGVSQSSINYWEKGERTPGFDQIYKLAHVLGVPLIALQSDTYEYDSQNDGTHTKYFHPVDATEDLIEIALTNLVKGLYGHCETIYAEVYDKDDWLFDSERYISVGDDKNKLTLTDCDWNSLKEIVCDLIKKIIPMIGAEDSATTISNQLKEKSSDRVELHEEKEGKIYILKDYNEEFDKVRNYSSHLISTSKTTNQPAPRE